MKTFPAERMLARTFFGRFFESDVLPAVPQVQVVMWSLAALAAPGFTIALRLERSYTHALHASRADLFDLGRVSVGGHRCASLRCWPTVGQVAKWAM